MTASLHELFPQSAPYIREGSRAEKRAVLTLSLAANDDERESEPSVVAGLVCVVALGLMGVGALSILGGAVSFVLWALERVAP